MTEPEAVAVAVLMLCSAWFAGTAILDKRGASRGWTESARALAAMPCYHRDRVAVEEFLTGDIVAALCLECDEQLPAGLAPVTYEWQAPATPLQPPLPDGTPYYEISHWGSPHPIRRAAAPRF